MQFSVVMPLLNSREFIAEAIQSIVSQNHKDWELLIVDGGSSDGSLDIVEGFMKQDARIKLIPQTGIGIYDAILSGFQAASGDVLSWLNADDMYVSWAMEIAENWMARSDVHWLTGTPTIWDKNGQQRCVFPHVPMPRILFKVGAFNPYCLGCLQAESTFFTRTLFNKLSSEDKDQISQLSLAGDFLIWQKFSKHKKLHLVPSVLGGFRIHGQNASIDRANEYYAEVKSLGGLALPNRMASLLRWVYGGFGKNTGRSLAVSENRRLNSSLGLK